MPPPSPVVIAIVIADDADFDSTGLCCAARHIADAAGARLEVLVLSSREDQGHTNAAIAAGAVSVHLMIEPQLMVPLHTEQLLATLQRPLADMIRATDAPLFVLHADVTSEELAARLAMRLKGHALGRCERIELAAQGWMAHKALLGGRIDAALQAGSGPCFAALRVQKNAAVPGTFAAERGEREAGTVTTMHLQTVLPKPEVRYERPGLERRRLENARIVVAGGRGMGSAEGFVTLQRVAELLDAPMGGSLPAVDAGWVPVSHQIGESGKFVTPEVYVAVGISGTVQHMAGIATHTDIVAINNDPDADIFKLATVGVVADWKAFLPVLIDKLQPAADGAEQTE